MDDSMGGRRAQKAGDLLTILDLPCYLGKQVLTDFFVALAQHWPRAKMVLGLQHCPNFRVWIKTRL